MRKENRALLEEEEEEEGIEEDHRIRVLARCAAKSRVRKTQRVRKTFASAANSNERRKIG